jgi:hypothetical protein
VGKGLLSVVSLALSSTGKSGLPLELHQELEGIARYTATTPYVRGGDVLVTESSRLSFEQVLWSVAGQAAPAQHWLRSAGSLHFYSFADDGYRLARTRAENVDHHKPA